MCACATEYGCTSLRLHFLVKQTGVVDVAGDKAITLVIVIFENVQYSFCMQNHSYINRDKVNVWMISGEQ